jgi:aspartate/methionine/tyrosine aminotransferase
MFKVLDRARKLEEQGARILHLELGNPRNAPPPEVVEATTASLSEGRLGYSSSAGLPALRQAIAERYSGRFGRSLGEDHVVVSPANLMISQFLDLVCERGDRVVFFTPAFPSYWAAAEHIGLVTGVVPLDPARGFELTGDDVDWAVAARPKAIIVNPANNPTGAVYDRQALEYLARRCAEAGIWLLSDETYGELSYGRPYFSLAALDYPQLVVMSSFSKVFSIPGFRVGYAIADPRVAEKLALSTMTLISCLPIFTQEGCLAGLPVLDEYLAGVKGRYRGIAKECAEAINAACVLRCAAPDSGFYIFVDIGDTGLDDFSFANGLLEERHTAVTPGSSFGEAYRDYIRLAFCGDRDDVAEGVKRIVSLARDRT